jgi:hypothetical protein
MYIRNAAERPGHYVPLPMDAIKAVYFGVLPESPGEFSLDYLRGCESRQRSF